MPASDSDECQLIDQLAEEFAERYRKGERPALKEYIDRYPQLADDIRALFPALAEMEQIKEVRREAQPGAPPLRQIGDYRIVREVGRGGMGVVYEAEQVSLGRRVAVKVLTPHSSSDRQALERFRREARAAAKLHHTNIVPVFDVGQDGETCYYAMQFIQGQSLDQIIDELRRLRSRDREGAGRCREPSGTEGPARLAGPTPAVDQLAQSLLTGRFEIERAADSPTPTEACPASVNGQSPADACEVTSSAVLPGQMDLSSVRMDHHYFQSVARIGWQTANALAYAHARGIIHRDIKPSNLLLDAAGVVWITDFGLAKTQDNALTNTGDLVGTFRYMAPERFQGEGDERVDVYSLGLTLYEMLLLRPAFVERDRLRLIDRIKNEEPPHPRAVDRHIPRDLETIVLKAIAKESKRRYRSAEDMAEDLRRFLANEPIRAKRTSHLVRLRLWSYRHPALAALLLVLALVAGGSTVAAFYLRATLVRVEKAELAGKHDLWLSYLAQARATRMSRQPGQRFASLRAIREALSLPVPLGHSREELRSEAIAALCLPDPELLCELGSETVGASSFAIDPAFRRYAWADKDGTVHLHRLGDDAELLRLPGDGPVNEYTGLQFSPNGRYLHHICNTPRGIHARLWDLDAAPPKAMPDDDHIGLGFRPDSREIAVTYRDRTIRFIDPASGRELRRFTLDVMSEDRLMFWNPKRPQLLIGNQGSKRLLDVNTGTTTAVGLRVPGGCSWAAWHPEGRLLAVAGEVDRKIYLWDVPQGRLVMPPLEGHKNRGVVPRFNHAGDRLLSTDWTDSGHLWDGRSGQLLLTLPGIHYSFFAFSADDRLMATAVDGKIRVYRFRRGEEWRTVVHRDKIGRSNWFDLVHGTPSPDAEGRLFAIGSDDGVELVDLARGEVAALLASPGSYPLRFDAKGALWTHGARGLLRWPASQDRQSGQRRYGPPRYVYLPTHWDPHGSSPDARILAIPDYGRGARVLNRDRGRMLRVGPQEDVRFCAVSPDGRWVATGSHILREGAGAKVWDASDGRHIADLPVGGACRVQFSPDGKWLLTTSGGPRLWAVSSWEEGPKLGGTPLNAWSAFTRDGKLLALGDAPGVVRLVGLDTGTEIARLTAPVQSRLAPCGFTPDGTQLIVVGVETLALHIFDLRAIRAGLAELDLDWDVLSSPSAPQGAETTPLAITVDTGVLVLGESPWQAIIRYSLALAVQPINPTAYLRRGHAYYQLGQWRSAADDLSLAFALDPGNKDAQAWSELGIACQQSFRLKEAVEAYSRLLQLEGEEASVYNRRSVAYYSLDLWDKAIADQEKALKLQADFPMAKNNLAWMLATCPGPRLRDPARAVKLAKQAVASLPKEGTFRITLGIAQYRAGDWAAARNDLQESLQLGQAKANPFGFGRTILFLAMSHWQLGEQEKARAFYRQAVEWIGKNQSALENDAGRWNELGRFRAEAASTLAQSSGYR